MWLQKEDIKDSNNDWQLTKLTLLERSSFMLNNSLMSDVKFIPKGRTANQPIYAHKYVLATSSPVFYQLFYGKSKKANFDDDDLYDSDLDNNQVDSVIEQGSFVDKIVFSFLRFLYKEECPENHKNIVPGVRDMATKYRVTSFETTCMEGLKEDTVVSDGEWQSTKSTLLSRNSYMYNNQLMSDFKFTYFLGNRDEEIFAHRYILATSSPVFYEMFYGKNVNKIHSIPMNYEQFVTAHFLRFLYKEECPNNFETVLKVLHMTKEYQVQSFQTVCKHSLEFDTPWPAFKVIEKLLEVDAEEMAEPWWSQIESRLEEVIASEYFLKINQRTLIAFLERDTLCYPEIDLFHATIKWSEYQCKLQKKRKTVENMRGVLGASIFRIRFLSLTEEDFKKHVVLSGVLTDTEVIAIIETMKSGTGNHKYHWALPARNRRTWLCEYYFVGQLKNMFRTIILGGLILTACAVFFA